MVNICLLSHNFYFIYFSRWIVYTIKTKIWEGTKSHFKATEEQWLSQQEYKKLGLQTKGRNGNKWVRIIVLSCLLYLYPGYSGLSCHWKHSIASVLWKYLLDIFFINKHLFSGLYFERHVFSFGYLEENIFLSLYVNLGGIVTTEYVWGMRYSALSWMRKQSVKVYFEIAIKNDEYRDISLYRECLWLCYSIQHLKCSRTGWLLAKERYISPSIQCFKIMCLCVCVLFDAHVFGVLNWFGCMVYE